MTTNQDEIVGKYLQYRKEGNVDAIMDLFTDKKDIFVIDRHQIKHVGRDAIHKALSSETPNIQEIKNIEHSSSQPNEVIATIRILAFHVMNVTRRA
jgi:hypothetical protein